MSVAFYPWLRRGMAAGVSSNATTDGRALSLVQLTLNEGQGPSAEVAVAVPLALHGPGDVAALEARAVRRVWPSPDSAGAPASYLAHIEFGDPDLPWRYTPSVAAAPGADRTSGFIPWIALLVLSRTEFRDERRADPATGRVESITVTDAQALPPVGRSWAWAHVQHEGPSATNLETDLAANPERYLARLLAPRRMRPNTTYTAVLVPTFERGRLAGLGRDVPAGVDGLAPAWTTAPVELPVYYRWSFTTGSGDDLETLLRRLRAQLVPSTVGARDLDGTEEGALGVAVAPAPLRLAGALRPPGKPPDDWPTSSMQTWQRALAKRTAADDELTPPLYGRWLVVRDRLVPGGVTWFDELNGDPRLRVAAALGVEVVRRNQETLMASAWDQVAGIAQLNTALRQAQLAREAARRVHARHLAQASPQRIVALAGPVMGRVRIRGGTSPISLRAQLDASLLPRGILSGSFRRLTRRYGRISRRQGLEHEPRSESVLERAASGAWRLGAPRGDTVEISLDALVEPTLLDLGSTLPPPGFMPIEMHDREAWWDALDRTTSSPQPHLGPGFNAALRAALPSLSFTPGPVAAPPVADLAGAAALLLTVLDPENAVTASLAPRITAPPGWAPADRLSPVMAAPTFPQPLVHQLKDLSPAWLAAGLADVPPDSVTVLAVNKAFVHAFLVGANHEMARELLWRRYPTDQRGTYFRRFWDAEGDDIDPIHQWTASTVDAAGLARPGRNGAVLVVRSQLFARYPNLLLYAVKAVPDSTAPRGRRFPFNNPTTVYPGMVGNLPPDVTYVGFDLSVADLVKDSGWYLVFHEPPHEPRFGLGTATGAPAASISDWSELTWEHLGVGPIIDLAANPPSPSTGTGGPNWSGGAVDLALILRRRPVRLAIHASDLMGSP